MYEATSILLYFWDKVVWWVLAPFVVLVIFAVVADSLFGREEG